jgi:hypothetical protein
MTARRTTIRQLTLTEVVDRDTPGAMPVSITTHESGTIYHTVPLADPDTGKRRDARLRSKRALGLLRLRRLDVREDSRYGSPGVVTHQIRSWFCDTAERVKGGRSPAK